MSSSGRYAHSVKAVGIIIPHVSSLIRVVFYTSAIALASKLPLCIASIQTVQEYVYYNLKICGNIMVCHASAINLNPIREGLQYVTLKF